MVVKKSMFSLKALRGVLVAGSAFWLPGVIGLLGRWLDVLALFGTVSAVGTGHYVAFATKRCWFKFPRLILLKTLNLHVEIPSRRRRPPAPKRSNENMYEK